MISRIAIRARWVRRKLSRTRWAARLMGIPLAKGETEEPGLIMIQLDGLSRSQFHKALHDGRVPYLANLIRRQHFHVESFYSGVPSTTPAVQGEIFFGVKAAVPSFEFLHRKSGKIFKMYQADAALEIERDLLEKCGEPLLKDAHVYSDIYRAGAAESHYCSADLAMDRIVKRLNPLKRLILSIFYLPKLLRVLGLVIVELCLAIVDCVRGLFESENIVRELMFVPARIGICIAVREVIRFRVLLDIERGVRVIHANFLGYDEQAHRRGPDSAFAHWTLKGIDKTVRDIHRAARRSGFRDYELLVYSDHGQERVQPYPVLHGRTVEDAIAGIFSEGPAAGREMWLPAIPKRGARPRGRPGHLLHQRPGNGRSNEPHDAAEKIIVTAMGPIGHIYLPLILPYHEKETYARELVEKAKIPLVLLDRGDGTVRAFNERGEWRLPRDGYEVVGEKHPFFEEAVEDLIRLCQHADAGDFIISGWDPMKPPVTFPSENGAHGGPGFQETHGFVLVPDRIYRWHRVHHPSHGNWMRGADLREVALHFLGRDGTRVERSLADDPARKGHELPLRVMTYNIHSCAGLDGKVRPERIARVMNYFDPDVIAVQEVDAHRPRSGSRDQAKLIADHLRMTHAFYAVFEEKVEKYGIAIFSRYPFNVVKTDVLTPAGPRWREARGAIWVTLDLGPERQPVHIINTHFGLARDEKHRQALELLGGGWLGAIPDDEPVILCGDFNSVPRSAVWKLLQNHMRDAQVAMKGHKPQATFSSLKPLVRIDHVFISRHFNVERIELPMTATAMVASDHLPLCVELSLDPGHDAS